MASIGDLIFKAMGKPDPRQQLMEAVMAQGGQPAAPQGTPTPQGTPAGGAAPAPVPQEAGVYKSPQELITLYGELMDRQSRNQMIDRGIGLMGASLAHPENRAGIMAAFNGGGGGGGGGGPGSMISQLMEFQQSNLTAQQKAAQRASVPAIAAQYGLDPTTALFLFDQGNLDAVIQEAAKPDRQIVQGNDGKHYIVDKKTNSIIGDPIGPDKPQELEVIEGPNNSKIVVDKITKEPIKGREPTVPEDPYAADTELTENWKRNNEDRKARGAPPLSLEEWKAVQSRTTQGAGIIDASGAQYPDPPKDMVWDMDERGVVRKDERGVPIAKPIGGTEIDLKNREAEEAKKAAEKVEAGQKSAKEQTADIVTTDIDRVMAIVEENKDAWVPATGLGAAAASWLPGTPQYDAEGLVTTIKANLGFDKLQAMRAASPSGAALGPVSDFENQLLQSVLGNMDLRQGREQLTYNLQRVKRIYSGIMKGEFMKDGQPDMEAVARANKEVIKDVPFDDLMKMYGPKE